MLRQAELIFYLYPLCIRRRLEPGCVHSEAYDDLWGGDALLAQYPRDVSGWYEQQVAFVVKVFGNLLYQKPCKKFVDMLCFEAFCDKLPLYRMDVGDDCLMLLSTHPYSSHAD